MSAMNNMGSSGQSGGWLGKAILVVLVWVVLAGVGYWLFAGRGGGQQDGKGSGGTASGSGKPKPEPGPPQPSVTIGVAYGTEKRDWLKWAVDEFAQTDDGKRITVKLIPMGSVEAGHAIAQGDTRIHVWSPASTLNCEVFMQEWESHHSGKPIVRKEELARTPMVFVMWKNRYDALKTTSPDEVSFQTIAKALEMEGGWGGLAQKPDWGLFKFGLTDPNKSNSGLSALVLMAYDFHKKNKDLSAADIVKPEFQAWLAQFARGASARSDSTGNLMQEMVRMGPSTYDALMVYESVAIDFLKKAEGRWGAVHVVYPKRNIWSDHPYCILGTEWCTKEHQQAAEKFLDFLLSDAVQTKALDHGFRPGNLNVPVNFPESPFVKYKDHGLQIDLTGICDSPSGDVITNLLDSWQRATGPR